MKKYGLLAFGGNVFSDYGSPDETIAQAIIQLNSNGIRLCDVSRFFKTPCFPAGAGPDYVNCAARIRTDLTPNKLLERLHEIEAEFGRVRSTRWAERPIDIDLISLDDSVSPDEQTQTRWRALSLESQKTTAPKELILPHPRLQDRAFVLAPLMDIAMTWRHPVLNLTIAQMFAQLPRSAREEVEPL